jgi:hypothetical protein
MTSIADQTTDHAHVVGFYGRDDELTSAVAAFLEAGLDDGVAGVVAATEAHRRALAEALGAARAGRVRWLDAERTLAKFMRDGAPDPARFASVIGAIIDEAALHGTPVRVFGEMVALLWESGNVAAAVELESLWNDLAAHHDFLLYCAYPMQLVGAVGELADTKAVCDHHSDVVLLPGGASHASAIGSADDDTYTAVFVPAASALSGVRALVAQVLRRWDADELFDDAIIVTCELAANAVRHARSPFAVTFTREHRASRSVIRVSVRDLSTAAPELLAHDTRRIGGRGVALVDALSRAWGSEAEPGGKTVWAELG